MEPSALILASASPRRVALLEQIGFTPDLVAPADIDETPLKQELPAPYAKRMAAKKACVIAKQHPGKFILAADTVVSCGRRILPKAETEKDAHHCLSLLSGRRHRVLGGIAVIAPNGRLYQKQVTSLVTFKRLSALEITRYLESGEWQGKAGGYAVQGRAAVFVRSLSGSYSNVVGLPLFETHALLSGLGYGNKS